MRGERIGGGGSRASLRQPRRSFSPANRNHGGEWGPARVADIGGDRGFWLAVRSRKRKATEPDHRGRDRSDGSDGYRGTAARYRQDRHQVSDGDFVGLHRERYKADDKRRNGEDRLSNKAGGHLVSSEWHGAAASDNHPGYKASFYVTNFPDKLPLFRLRQAFEVCGMLSDVYVARHRNTRGQEFAFVRYVNVRNRNKLAQALNNVWIGDCRVWAREARFDRFARKDVLGGFAKNSVREEHEGFKAVWEQRGEGGSTRLVATKGVQNLHFDGDRVVRVGNVEVPVRGGGKKLKLRREAVSAGAVTVATTDVGHGTVGAVTAAITDVAHGIELTGTGVAAAGRLRPQQQLKALAGHFPNVNAGTAATATAVLQGYGNSNKGTVHAVAAAGTSIRDQHVKVQVSEPEQTNNTAAVNSKACFRFSPVYSSAAADRSWATSGLIATVHGGDSVAARQQRVEDAGFPFVVVTPMGGDRVFLYCAGEKDIWKVFHEAIDFFSVLFSSAIKWSAEEVRYERGAWLRVYGIPIHAWNENFFRLCVTEIGRFIQADESTVSKARLDYARVLVSTSQIEILNTTSDYVIDGRKFILKLVEEWGYVLGEDAFLPEVESSPEASCHPNEDVGVEEVQGAWELDDLVNDLHKEWSQHEGKAAASLNSHHSTPKNHVVEDRNSEFFEVQLSPVLQPVSMPNNEVDNGAGLNESSKHHVRAPVVPHRGPWSLDGLPHQKPILEGGVAFSSTSDVRKSKQVESVNDKLISSSGNVLTKGKKGGVVHKSVGFMKKIARMPAKDRNQILRILKKQKRKRKVSAAHASSKDTTESGTTSKDKSSSSGGNDWVHWVHLHGEPKVVAEDVQDLGKIVGVQYLCNTTNTFNLLSREGRREWRAAGGGDVANEDVEGQKAE